VFQLRWRLVDSLRGVCENKKRGVKLKLSGMLMISFYMICFFALQAWAIDVLIYPYDDLDYENATAYDLNRDENCECYCFENNE